MPTSHSTLSGNPRLSALWITDPGGALLECKLALITQGSVDAAAVALQVDRRTFYRWMARYPALRTTVRECLPNRRERLRMRIDEPKRVGT